MHNTIDMLNKRKTYVVNNEDLKAQVERISAKKVSLNRSATREHRYKMKGPNSEENCNETKLSKLAAVRRLAAVSNAEQNLERWMKFIKEAEDANKDKQEESDKVNKRYNVFKQWCRATTWHGWADLYSAPHRYERYIWTVVITFIFILFFQDIIFMIISFFNENQWTSRTFDGSIGDLRFPKILLCNYNRINVTKSINKWHMNVTHRNYINRYFTYTLNEADMSSILEKENEKKIIEAEEAAFLDWYSKYASNISFFDLLHDLGHNCKSTLRFLIFGGRVISDPCQYMGTYYMPQFGRCLLIQLGNKSGIISKAGIDNSLKLVLDVNQDNYQVSATNTFWDAGFAMYLFNEREYQDARNKSQWGSNSWTYPNKWISLAPKYHTWLALTLDYNYLAPKESGIFRTSLTAAPCIGDDYKFAVVEGFAYDNEICELDCEYNTTQARCGCIPYYNSSRFAMCEPKKTSLCMSEWSKEVANSSARNVSFVASAQCREERCSVPCTAYNLKSQLSFSGFPASSQLETMQEMIQESSGVNLTTEYIKENILAVDIFYETLLTQSTEWYQKVTLSSLASSIGGQLGLCAGISIMTFLQGMWYLSYAIRGCIANRKKRKKIYPSPRSDDEQPR